jgi:hypothetical protein
MAAARAVAALDNAIVGRVPKVRMGTRRAAALDAILLDAQKSRSHGADFNHRDLLSVAEARSGIGPAGSSTHTCGWS